MSLSLASKVHKKVKVVDVATVIKAIPDNAVIATGGFVSTAIPEYIYRELAKNYRDTRHPANLTLVYAAGQGDGDSRGLNHLAEEGLVGQLIGGHYGLVPKLGKQVIAGKIKGYNLPQGVVSHLFRAIAGKKPLIISQVGLGTFVDPDFGGGKLNSITTEELVGKVSIEGQDYLTYKTFPINVAILRGTLADSAGNISLKREALTTESLAIAMAAHNSGGIVIVQVERLVQHGSLGAREVEIPGILVDYVVVSEEPDVTHQQTFATRYSPSFSGEAKVPLEAIKPLPFSERKIIARRAAYELRPYQVVNLGIGMPEGVSKVAAEEGLLDYVTLTTEPGAIGGIPAGGMDFGAADNPEAIIDQPSQFDFYDGGGLDIAFLGLAQVDKEGNLNVSKFGPKLAGAGGFINISQNAKKVVYVGTFTAVGLEIQLENSQLQIIQEGKQKKFVEEVEHRTFSGSVAYRKGQEVLYVTERCVFRLCDGGIELIEIAPGVDLNKDILAHMDFVPQISPDLKLMDAAIFTPDFAGNHLHDAFCG